MCEAASEHLQGRGIPDKTPYIYHQPDPLCTHFHRSWLTGHRCSRTPLHPYMEMFAWETTRKVFHEGITKELFTPTKVMAANQDLYNGFLAGGLIWSLFIQDDCGNNMLLPSFMLCGGSRTGMAASPARDHHHILITLLWHFMCAAALPERT